MSKLFAAVKRFFGRKEEGVTMIEYALMLALIAAVCIAAVTLLGVNSNRLFKRMKRQWGFSPIIQRTSFCQGMPSPVGLLEGQVNS
jgi:Flp pilus assembly pilin Flp